LAGSFLGLARTFIYGLEDIDRGADAMRAAQKLGYAVGDRETLQLADGYRARGDGLFETARQLAELPQEPEYLQRAADAYRQAQGLYERIPGFPGAARPACAAPAAVSSRSTPAMPSASSPERRANPSRCNGGNLHKPPPNVTLAASRAIDLRPLRSRRHCSPRQHWPSRSSRPHISAPSPRRGPKRRPPVRSSI
jgi:hypothetical protein